MSKRWIMIGILDSGIGGLRAARELLDRVPDADLIYFGDTARSPYGVKHGDTIRRNASEGLKFLLAAGATIICIPCSDISGAGFDLPDGLPRRSIIDAVSAGTHAALALPQLNRIGIIGTPATIASHAFEMALAAAKPGARVYANPCPLIVPLVEAGRLTKPETFRIIKNCVSPLKRRRVDTLILACSHFAVLRRTIQRKIGKRVFLVDAAEAAVADTAARISGSPGAVSRGKTSRFLVTDRSEYVEHAARILFGGPVALELAPIPPIRSETSPPEAS